MHPNMTLGLPVPVMSGIVKVVYKGSLLMIMKGTGSGIVQLAVMESNGEAGWNGV